MDRRVLRINHDGYKVEVEVDDSDECVLIDVINDMYDEFSKRGYTLPQYPAYLDLEFSKAIKGNKPNETQTITKPPPSRQKLPAYTHSNEGEELYDDSGSSSDSEYKPVESDGESEHVIPDDFEYEGNLMELLRENYIDGDWEPFRMTNVVYEDDRGYQSRMYKNGEVYDDANMGKIKYIVEYADIRCSWRIHASKLVDEHTWVIKSIREGHNCDPLINNPMCNCDWAASKLLEDIRDSPDIKGKAMNAELWERYGLTMATSTLYKMKAKAMLSIQGAMMIHIGTSYPTMN
ncbi:GRIP1-associated protein 1 [Bienertia sinuspersici]